LQLLDISSRCAARRTLDPQWQSDCHTKGLYSVDPRKTPCLEREFTGCPAVHGQPLQQAGSEQGPRQQPVKNVPAHGIPDCMPNVNMLQVIQVDIQQVDPLECGQLLLEGSNEIECTTVQGKRLIKSAICK